MLLVIDNYDSFTWNLVQYAGELGAEPVVVRNDQESVDQLLARRAQAILISPGPCTPLEAGVSVPLIRRAAGKVPILGVCLGHQAIGEAFGARVVRAGRLMHGKTTRIEHSATELFDGVANPVTVMRYHSLVVAPEQLPPELEVTAWSSDRAKGEEIMALRHRELAVWGVQFHPESIGTEGGKRIIANFLKLAGFRSVALSVGGV
jgi:anthranilate synthase/aminodeoxychorismate synthase-like glutamine amidotransferase